MENNIFDILEKNKSKVNHFQVKNISFLNKDEVVNNMKEIMPYPDFSRSFKLDDNVECNVKFDLYSNYGILLYKDVNMDLHKAFKDFWLGVDYGESIDDVSDLFTDNSIHNLIVNGITEIIRENNKELEVSDIKDKVKTGTLNIDGYKAPFVEIDLKNTTDKEREKIYKDNFVK